MTPEEMELLIKIQNSRIEKMMEIIDIQSKQIINLLERIDLIQDSIDMIVKSFAKLKK